MLLMQGSTPAPARVLDQANVAVLQAKLADLRTRVAVLQAQRNVLVATARSDNPAVRLDAENRILNLDLDLASVKAQVMSIEGQLGVATQEVPAPPAVPGVAVPPSPPVSPPMIDPDAVTAVFVLTALAVLIPLSIGISRRLWRRPAPPVSALEDKLSPRLDRLEQAVDAIAIEVERISESQRFVTRVLTERAPSTNAQSSSDAALGEGKPFLALGAGPMEAIPVVQRQGVKQSITPH